MFENMTYETILKNMLDKVTSDVDKREGSIIYDALAPCAFQLAQSYFMLDNFINLVSGDTAVGEFLDRVVADYGITRKVATSAVRKIVTTDNIDVGTRWGLNDTTYIITDIISSNNYKAKCEQKGAIGNLYSGVLDSIDNVSNITATLSDIFSYGTDEETDNNLRDRFYSQIRKPSTSGNADNYIKWALKVPGVGDAKVFPLWNGPGTVKLLVVDNKMCINEQLEQKVYDYIETVRPIGATVTVDSPSSKIINVASSIELDGTKTIQEVKTEFIGSLTKYLKDTIFDTYNISYAKIGSILLATNGVRDYSNLRINNDISNVSIEETGLPIVGTVTLEVV